MDIRRTVSGKSLRHFLTVSYTHLPFNTVELQARVKSQLRRYMKLGGCTVRPDTIVIGGIELNDVTKEVTLDGDKVQLTRTEYDILKLLMLHQKF